MKAESAQLCDILAIYAASISANGYLKMDDFYLRNYDYGCSSMLIFMETSFMLLEVEIYIS